MIAATAAALLGSLVAALFLPARSAGEVTISAEVPAARVVQRVGAGAAGAVSPSTIALHPALRPTMAMSPGGSSSSPKDLDTVAATP